MSNQCYAERNAETVLELLIGQCADLEKLLILARRETQAAESGDFAALLQLVEQRQSLDAKLEIYQRQTEDLRESMMQECPTERWQTLAQRATGLISLIQSQDAQTRPHLMAAREDALLRLKALAPAQKSLCAYLAAPSAGNVAYDQIC